HADVEHRVGLVRRAAADAAGNPGSVAGIAVHAAVVVRLGCRRRDRGARVELPAEQLAEVAPELRRLLPDDLEVHNRLRHGYSLRAGRARGCRPPSDDGHGPENSAAQGHARGVTGTDCLYVAADRRRRTHMRRPAAAVGSALFFAGAPGVVGGGVPVWVPRWQGRGPLAHWAPVRVAGLIMLILGAIVLVQAFA